VAASDGATDVSQVIAAIDWLVQHKQYVGVSLGLVYNYYFNMMLDGESLTTNAMLFQVVPGLFYSFSRIASLEITAPISVAAARLSVCQSFFPVRAFSANTRSVSCGATTTVSPTRTGVVFDASCATCAPMNPVAPVTQTVTTSAWASCCSLRTLGAPP